MNELPSLQAIWHKQGERFGSLTVIRFAETNRKRATWLCQCDCGKEIIAVGAYLRDGTTHSCGCKHKTIVQHEPGEQFGSLIVLGYAGSIRRHGRNWTGWLCQCDCGSEVTVIGQHLRNGKAKSCVGRRKH